MKERCVLTSGTPVPCPSVEKTLTIVKELSPNCLKELYLHVRTNSNKPFETKDQECQKKTGWLTIEDGRIVYPIADVIENSVQITIVNPTIGLLGDDYD